MDTPGLPGICGAHLHSGSQGLLPVGAAMAEGLRGYDVLARHYDVLMQCLPYWRWADFIHRYAQNFGKGATILDAGCGTGTVTLALARRAQGRGNRRIGRNVGPGSAKDGADRVTCCTPAFGGKIALPRLYLHL